MDCPAFTVITGWVGAGTSRMSRAWLMYPRAFLMSSSLRLVGDAMLAFLGSQFRLLTQPACCRAAAPGDVVSKPLVAFRGRAAGDRGQSVSSRVTPHVGGVCRAAGPGQDRGP